MSAPAKYKVMLIIPSPIVMRGVKDMLSEYPEFEVVAALSDFSQGAARIAALQPDVVLVDPLVFDYSKRLSVRAGFPCLQDCVVLAMCTSILEDEAAKHYDAVLSVYDPQVQFIHKFRRAAAAGKPDPDAADVDEISQREREILIAVARGKTNKEIADMHNISVHTVISHRKNISRKTGIKTVSGLTVYALLNNLIDQTDV